MPDQKKDAIQSKPQSGSKDEGGQDPKNSPSPAEGSEKTVDEAIQKQEEKGEE
jgi:hypothetical protein